MFFQTPPLPPERPPVVAPIFSAASTTFLKVTDCEVSVVDPQSNRKLTPRRTHIESRAVKKPLIIEIIIPIKIDNRTGRK